MKNLLLLLFLTFVAGEAFPAHFKTGSSVPTQDLVSELQDLYEAKIKGHKVYEITIEGHTDSRGSIKFNQALSEARAKAALEKLKEMGLKSDKVKTVGFGESKLLTLGLRSKDHAKNRRVVVFIKSDKGETKTIISECKPEVKEKIIVKEKKVYRKNAVKLFVGHGPNELDKVNSGRVELEKDPFLGVGYQRMINDRFSVEAIGTTNESFMIGGGLHF